jgi:hypothetical protein
MSCKIEFKMQSSRHDRWYDVSYDSTRSEAVNDDAQWRCGCIGYRAHKKPCRHINNAREAMILGVRKMEVDVT